MTARELFEFAKKYNLEDAKLQFQLQFHDGFYYGICHAKLNVDKDFPDQNRIILSDE